MKSYKKISLFLGIFLVAILMMSFSSAGYKESSSKYYYGGSQSSFLQNPASLSNVEMCKEGQDFIIQIDPAGCTPAVVRSDLLEEQEVPVFCPLKAIKINPLIEVDAIRSMSFSGEWDNAVRRVGFYGSKSALGHNEEINSFNYDTVGYAVISLGQQKNESAMPEFVEGNLTATIRYDIENAFGIRTNQFYLPVLSEDEWELNKNKYYFWDGRGYLRAEHISESGAEIGIYSDTYNTPFEGDVGEKRKLNSVSLDVGEKSEVFYLPGFGCFAGLNLKLEEIGGVGTFAKLKINSEYYDIQEKEKFLDEMCYIENNGIKEIGIYKEAEIYCRGKGGGSFNLIISPKVNIKIGDTERLAKVGDYLYSSPEGKKVFLGYARTKKKNSQNENLEITLVSFPQEYKGDDGLSSDLISKIGEVTESYNVFEDGADDLRLGGLLGKSGKAIFGALVQSYDFLVKGESYVFIDYGSPETVWGKKVSIIGFGEGEDIPFVTDEAKDYYEKALRDYDYVINNYLNEKYPEEDKKTIAEKAFRGKINLASSLNQKRTMITFCDEFENYFTDVIKPLVCEDPEKISNSEISEVNVVINGESKLISLEGTYKPLPEDYSVDLAIKDIGTNKVVDSFKLIEDKKYYIGDSEEEYVKLISIKDRNHALIEIRTGKTSTRQQIVDVFTLSEVLEKKVPKSLGSGYNFIIEEIHLKEFAKVKIIPDLHYSTSEAKFPFKIGIEKRGIQLSPEVAANKIDRLNKTIEEWTKISENLGTAVKTMKAACVATGAALTVKNLIENSKGKSISRNEVMTSSGGWNEQCVDYGSMTCGSKTCVSKEDCLFSHSKEIDKEVNDHYDQLKIQNEKIETIQKDHTVDGGAFGKNFVNTSGFGNEYSKNIKENVLGDEKITFNEKTVDLKEFKKLLNEESFEQGNYDIEKLKQIELNYKLWEGEDKSDDSVYRKRLFKILTDVNQNSKNFVEREDFADRTGLENSYVDYTGLEKISVSKHELFKDSKYYSQNKGLMEEGHVFSYKKGVKEYVVNYDGTGTVVEAYLVEDSGSLKKLSDEELTDNLKLHVKEYNRNSYQNKYKKEPLVRYYEVEPYKGFPALVPFPFTSLTDKSVQEGWYVHIQQNLPVGGKIGSYDLSGVVTSFYLCNIGENGIEEFKPGFGDDDCQLVNRGTGQPYNQFPGLSKEESGALVTSAIQAIYDAQTGHSVGVSRVTILGKSYRVGEPATSTPGVECTDFMSPKDCKTLFNVCDPVICPNSRCDFGGTYPVKDVIQSGIIGSLALCLPNYREGIYVPVCLTGVKAGMDSWISTLDSYKECLDYNLQTGETVGVCDEIHSVYMCEFFWRQTLPIAKLITPKALGLIMGEKPSRGGGEYLGVQSAWENAQDSVSYLTQYYAANSYKAFKFRSSEQVGSAVCKNFVSLSYPEGASLLDVITEPDSPPQFNGRFDEIPFTTATNPPISHYKTYYHIYAGNDRGAYYRVYLRGSTGSSFYQDNSFGRIVASSYIPKGEYKSETIDFTAPSGFKELCINVNGQEECGFAQVSTNFALNYVKDKYVERQALEEDIKTEKGCVSGSPDLYSLLNPNLQEGAADLIDPQIYDRGIIRICSTRNPGLGSDTSINMEEQRWVEKGYCGDPSIKCWLDRDSVGDAVEFQITKDTILNETTEQLIEEIFEKENYLNETGFKSKIKEIGQTSILTEKLEKIESIFEKVFYSNHQAYLYFLRGQTYHEFAEKAKPKPVDPQKDKKTGEGDKDEDEIDADKFVIADYPKLRLDEICYKYFEDKWHWTNDCNNIGREKFIFGADSKTVTSSYLVEWSDIKDFASVYGDEPNTENKEVILGLQTKESYEDGLGFIIQKTNEFKETLSTSNTKMSKEKVFELIDSERKEEIYFIHKQDGWYWWFSELDEDDEKWTSITNTDASVFSSSIFGIQNPLARSPNEKHLSKEAKILVGLLKDKNFIEGAGFLFSVSLGGKEVSLKTEKGEYVLRDRKTYTLEGAMMIILGLEGKYSEKENKEFIDDVCAQIGSDLEILTQEECDKITGEKWYTREKKMKYVKEILIRKQRFNKKSWALESAILQVSLLEGSYLDDKNNVFIESFYEDGILEKELYDEIKDNPKKEIMTELEEYLKKKFVSKRNADCVIEWEDPQLGEILEECPVIVLDEESSEYATQVSAGNGYTCVLTNKGNVDCYGGSQGIEKIEDYLEGDAIQVSTRNLRTCVLTKGGNVDCFGWYFAGEKEELGLKDYTKGDAVNVSLGITHFCVLTKDGNVDCVGGGNENNEYGQSEDYLEGDAIQVSAGNWHTCVLTKDGNVDCYGGIQGIEKIEDYLEGDAIQVSAGNMHTCVLTKDGNVDCYGDIRGGGDHSEDYLEGDAIQVSAGGYHTCILKKDKTVECYGDNEEGQSEDYIKEDAIQVSAGFQHTCILKKDKTVYCYGNNENGQSEDYFGKGIVETCVIDFEDPQLGEIIEECGIVEPDESCGDVSRDEMMTRMEARGIDTSGLSDEELGTIYDRDCALLEIDLLEKSLKNIIVLDPGHGGKDPGTIAVDDTTYEKDLNLKFAKKLKPLLEAKGYIVFLTRTTDTEVNSKELDVNGDEETDLSDELTLRTDFAKEKNADYFISIHFNSINNSIVKNGETLFKDNSIVKGTEVYFSAIKDADSIGNGKLDVCTKDDCLELDKDSLTFAERLGNKLDDQFKVRIRGADLGILTRKPAIESILLEVEYLSNPTVLSNLKKEEVFDSYVKAVADAFSDVEEKIINKEEKKEISFSKKDGVIRVNLNSNCATDSSYITVNPVADDLSGGESCEISEPETPLYLEIVDEEKGIYILKADKDYASQKVQNFFWKGILKAMSYFSNDPELGRISIFERDILYDKNEITDPLLEDSLLTEESLVIAFKENYYSEETPASLKEAILFARDTGLNNEFNFMKCKCGEDYTCLRDIYYINKYSREYNLDPALMLSLIIQESGCDQSASSFAGAYGLTQITKSTFESSCDGLGLGTFESVKGTTNSKNNIQCGIKILKDKYDKFGNGVEESSPYVRNFNSFKDLIDGCSEEYPKYKEYSSWRAALRGYNGWGCTEPYADLDYTEKIMGFYDDLQSNFA